MSENKVVLKKYLLSRLNGGYVLLQRHLESGMEICVIKKKGGNIDPEFVKAVQKQAYINNVSLLGDSDSCLRLEAETEDQLNFLFKC